MENIFQKSLKVERNVGFADLDLKRWVQVMKVLM
jgi:hypothetical protein